MVPPMTMSRVNFFILVNYSASPIKSISKLGSSLNPHPLNLCSPTRLQDFIQIDAHTHIEVIRDHRERGIARIVEPPRLDADVMDRCAVFLKERHGVVRRSGISDENKVGFASGLA